MPGNYDEAQRQGRRGGGPQREMGALRRHACEGQRGNQESTSQSRRQPAPPVPAEVHDRRTAKAKLARPATRSMSGNSSRPRRSRLKSRAGGSPTVSSRTARTRSRRPPAHCGGATRSVIRRRETNRAMAVYDMMVQESRELVKIGKLDEAEAKARQAQRMNVVPSLTSDRAESVLARDRHARPVQA